MTSEFNRKRRVLLGAGLTIGMAPLSLSAAFPTPSQPRGPFYPLELPLDDDNDLTRSAGSDKPAEGLSTDLSGRLLTPDGRSVEGARIEIWQCDARGHYHHPRDRGFATRDPGFQGHGRTVTDREGRYRFRTIRPVPYPGRAPHIHAAVFMGDRTELVTQIYISGEPGNSSDFLFSRVPSERRSLLTADFVRTPNAASDYSAAFDMILGHTPVQA